MSRKSLVNTYQFAVNDHSHTADEFRKNVLLNKKEWCDPTGAPFVTFPLPNPEGTCYLIALLQAFQTYWPLGGVVADHLNRVLKKTPGAEDAFAPCSLTADFDAYMDLAKYITEKSPWDPKRDFSQALGLLVRSFPDLDPLFNVVYNKINTDVNGRIIKTTYSGNYIELSNDFHDAQMLERSPVKPGEPVRNEITWASKVIVLRNGEGYGHFPSRLFVDGKYYSPFATIEYYDNPGATNPDWASWGWHVTCICERNNEIVMMDDNVVRKTGWKYIQFTKYTSMVFYRLEEFVRQVKPSKWQ